MTRLNKVLLQGRLGGEPEIRHLEGDKMMATFNMAVDMGYRDKQGGWKEDTNWFRIVTFQKKLIEKRLSSGNLKGQTVLIDGELKSQDFKDKDDNKRRSVEIQVGPYGSIDVIHTKQKKEEGDHDVGQETAGTGTDGSSA